MRFLSLFAAAFCCLVVSGAAQAHEYNVGSLHIIHPWSRETPKGASVAAGYLIIENKGTTPDRLIGGSAEIAGRFQIHEMKTENGVMRMRELDKGVEIPAGGSVKFAPNGYHIMLLDLKSTPVQGKPFMGTLVFEKAGKVEVKFVVAPVGSMDGKSGKGAGAMNHMDHMDGQMDHMKMDKH
jgi:hypothetical protein